MTKSDLIERDKQDYSKKIVEENCLQRSEFYDIMSKDKSKQTFRFDYIFTLK